MRFFVAGAAFLAALVAGTHTDDHVSDGSTTNSCDDGVFCNGISLPTTSGGCTPLDDPCDDLDDTTVDTCDEEYRRCYHVVASGDDAVCRVDCVSDCEGKDCGEDGCGSFCGTCETGEGCSGVGLCTVGTLEGTCNAPLNLGGGDSPYVLALPDDGDRITVVTEGDTSNAVHLLVPSCNYLTAAPELVYAFEVPEELVADGASVGFDIRVHGYDTVLEVMFGTCAIDNSIGCADDSVPPGEFGSRVAGMITTAGSYYVMVDGFSSSEKGEFELTATFVRNCEPECDGNFCGADLCGAQCGSCGDGETCNLEDTRCYPSDCEPQCAGVNRVCGADGCGGTCGTCGGDECVALRRRVDDYGAIAPTPTHTRTQSLSRALAHPLSHSRSHQPIHSLSLTHRHLTSTHARAQPKTGTAWVRASAWRRRATPCRTPPACPSTIATTTVPSATRAAAATSSAAPTASATTPPAACRT